MCNGIDISWMPTRTVQFYYSTRGLADQPLGDPVIVDDAGVAELVLPYGQLTRLDPLVK